MQLGTAPRNEAAVIPDEAVTLVERDQGHRLFLASKQPVLRPRLAAGASPGSGSLLEFYIREDALGISKVAR
jgi:hypothetical protein